MRLATIKHKNKEVASILVESGIVPIEVINSHFDKNWPTDMSELIQAEKVEEINDRYQKEGKEKLAVLGDKIISRELGRYVVWLGSAANTYVTGQNILVDGGSVPAY